MGKTPVSMSSLGIFDLLLFVLSYSLTGQKKTTINNNNNNNNFIGTFYAVD